MSIIATALALTAGLVPSAQAVGEIPAPDTLVPVIDTEFYQISSRKISVPVGSPYITALGPSNVLSLDWDFELAFTDIGAGTSRALGSLGLPAESRVLDIYWDSLMPRNVGRASVMVAYGEFGVDKCRRSVLREARIDLTGAGANALGTIWFTSPCYPAIEGYTLSQSGGRITRAIASITGVKNPQQFFFTVGDFALSRAQMKVLPVKSRKYLTTATLLTGPREAQIWARGLRNAQGLTTAFVDNKHVLLATLHGPRGGDQINVVERDGDYGWPYYSYGTPYGENQPQNTAKNQGYSTQKYPPLFAWVPSIGPTSVIQVFGPTYFSWWGNGKNTSDVIVNGMGSNWLYRLRIDSGSVRYIEPILTGVRLRTLIQMPNGTLVGGIDGSSSELIVFSPSAIWDVSGGYKAL
jgi:hypothetical protein